MTTKVEQKSQQSQPAQQEHKSVEDWAADLKLSGIIVPGLGTYYRLKCPHCDNWRCRWLLAKLTGDIHYQHKCQKVNDVVKELGDLGQKLD